MVEVRRTQPCSEWAFLVSLRRGGGVERTPTSNFLQLKLLRRYFDNSQFISSLFNFPLESNMTSYDVTITSKFRFLQNLAYEEYNSFRDVSDLGKRQINDTEKKKSSF